MLTFREFINENYEDIVEGGPFPRSAFFGFTGRRLKTLFESNLYISEENDAIIQVFAYFPTQFDDNGHCECNPIVNRANAFGWSCQATFDQFGRHSIRINEGSDEPDCLFYRFFTGVVIASLERYLQVKGDVGYDA